MTDSLARHYLDDAKVRFAEYRSLAERALAQVSDDDFARAIDAESNSLALVVKHVAGNLRSRWTDFLTTDGEKPDRRRDTEFEAAEADTREALSARWDAGWSALFGALDGLAEDDLLKTVLIRAEPHTVVQAIDRSLTHVAYHSGQIVFLAKHLVSSDWKTLSVPRGGTVAFNEAKMGGSEEP